MTTRCAIGLFFLLVTTHCSPTQRKLLADEANDVDYRLPKSVVPINYDISLKFPESSFDGTGNNFTGRSTIEVRTDNVTEIKLHAAHDFIKITNLTIINYQNVTEDDSNDSQNENDSSQNNPDEDNSSENNPDNEDTSENNQDKDNTSENSKQTKSETSNDNQNKRYLNQDNQHKDSSTAGLPVEVILTEDDYSIDSTTDILTIRFNATGENYTLVIDYEGQISTTDNYGIYRSSYTNSSNATVYLLATQFEAVYARRAFPCFDEPSFKATYDFSVTYPDGLSVLFNTPQKNNVAPENGTNTVSFETTPIMSSYLIALIVSDFTSTPGENVQGDNVQYAVWSRNDFDASREFAVEKGPVILQKLNEYTGRLYGTDINKVDQVAVPDFAAGAMENWGLVTYRERYLLWNSESSTTNSKQVIATIIAHEFAHQWFGNLITCDWWSVTFLNEGFATYFEYFIPHLIEPTWELDKQFVVNVVHAALESDSLEASQALQSEISSPLEISSKFGDISYKKGGSIIRMVTHIMGEDNFKAGIKEYISSTELQYSTSVPSKLWENLEKHVNNTHSALQSVNLSTVMQNWVEKPGYPLLKVTLEGKTLKISQERFLFTGEDNSTKWYVPITYVESTTSILQETNPITWLTPDVSEINIPLENENSWVLLNPLQTGYYRVNYDTNLWGNISAALKKENFDGIMDLNRAQIVDDLFSMAKANKISYSETFNIIDFLKNDTAYYPWVAAFKGFSYMRQRIQEGTDLGTKLQDHLLTLMTTLYNSVSFEELKDDDQIYTSTQVLAVSWACTLGEETCVNKSMTLFKAHTINGTQINKNLKNVVYCNALRNSNDTNDYNFLWDLYVQTELSSEKTAILGSLGCSSNEEKLKELLYETVKDSEESQIKSQDALTAFAAVYGGSERGVDVALDFLVNNFTLIISKYTTMSAQSSIVTGIAARLTKQDQVEKLQSLLESNPAFSDELKEVSEKALEQAQSNLDWMQNHQTDLEEFYDEDNNDSGGNGANTTHINMILLTVISLFSMSKFLSN